MPAASSTNNYPSVFALNSAGNVYEIALTAAGSWSGIGSGPVGQSVTGVSGVTATSSTGGYPSVFVINSAGNVYDLVYNTSTNAWGAVGGVIDSDIMAIAPVSNTWLVALDASRNVHYFEYSNGSWVLTAG